METADIPKCNIPSVFLYKNNRKIMSQDVKALQILMNWHNMIKLQNNKLTNNFVKYKCCKNLDYELVTYRTSHAVLLQNKYCSLYFPIPSLFVWGTYARNLVFVSCAMKSDWLWSITSLWTSPIVYNINLRWGS